VWLGREGRWEGEGIRQQAKDSERQIKKGRRRSSYHSRTRSKRRTDGEREREPETNAAKNIINPSRGQEGFPFPHLWWLLLAASYCLFLCFASSAQQPIGLLGVAFAPCCLLEVEDWFLPGLGFNCKQARKLSHCRLVVHQQMGKDEESYYHQAPLLLKIK